MSYFFAENQVRKLRSDPWYTFTAIYSLYQKSSRLILSHLLLNKKWKVSYGKKNHAFVQMVAARLSKIKSLHHSWSLRKNKFTAVSSGRFFQINNNNNCSQFWCIPEHLPSFSFRFPPQCASPVFQLLFTTVSTSLPPPCWCPQLPKWLIQLTFSTVNFYPSPLPWCSLPNVFYLFICRGRGSSLPWFDISTAWLTYTSPVFIKQGAPLDLFCR